MNISFTNTNLTFCSTGRFYKAKDGDEFGCNSWLFRDDMDWKKLAEYEIAHFKDKEQVNTLMFAASDGSEAYTNIISLYENSKAQDDTKKFFPIMAYDLDEEIVKAAKSGYIKTCLNDRMQLQMKCNNYEDYFEIVAYESWNNSENQKLMLAVKELVGEKADGGVPFIVIGNSYHLVGFGKSSGEEIINKALEAYQDKKYTDIVAKTIKDEKVSPTAETIVEAAEKEGIEVKNGTKKASKGISDKAVIGIVFSALILGFVGLVFMSRK